MSENNGEDLFDNIDLNNDLGGDDEGVDLNDFINGTFEDNTQGTDSNEDSGQNENDDDNSDEEQPPEEGVDASEFEQDSTQDSTEDNTSVDDDSSADNSSSPLDLIASTLQAEGVIDLEEGVKVESSKQILDAVRKKIEENEFADLNDSQKLYIEALRKGVPEEDVKQNLQNIQALDNISTDNIEANEELAKTLVTQDFIAKGLSAEKAAKLTQRSLEAGELIEDAKEAHTSLKTLEGDRIKEETKKRTEEEAANAKSNATKLEELKGTVLKKEEFIPGFKTNSATREKVYQNMTKVVSHDKSGNPLNALNTARAKDPEKIEMIESYLYTVTKGFTDWSTFKNKVKSNAVKDLDEKLKGTQSGSGNSSQSVSKENGGGLTEALFNLKL